MGRPPRITKAQLLETARSIFTERGYESTTLADIASALGVTPAALLRYVDSKEDLFREAMASRDRSLPAFVEIIRDADGSEDPLVLLRNFARQFVPFLVHRTQEQLAEYMHAKSGIFAEPFHDAPESSPPARAVEIFARYFARLRDRGLMTTQHPRADALLFLGSLQSYIFMHHILRISKRPFPLEQYLDELFRIWGEGAFKSRPAARRKRQ